MIVKNICFKKAEVQPQVSTVKIYLVYMSAHNTKLGDNYNLLIKYTSLF